MRSQVLEHRHSRRWPMRRAEHPKSNWVRSCGGYRFAVLPVGRRLGMAINQRVERQYGDEAGNGQGIHHGPPTDFLDDAKNACLGDEESARAAHRRRSAPRQSQHFEQRNGETGGEYQRRQTHQMRSHQINHTAQHCICGGSEIDRNRGDGIDVRGEIHEARSQQQGHRAGVRVFLRAVTVAPQRGHIVGASARGTTNSQLGHTMQGARIELRSGPIKRQTCALSSVARATNDNRPARMKQIAPGSSDTTSDDRSLK